MEPSRNSVLRISDAKTLELIKLYEAEECLWNTELPSYKNRLKRAAAAERIAIKLAVDKFDGRHVAIKFKNLRNSYCQELKKISYSCTMSDIVQYKPKVFWFDKMDSFLRPHLQSACGADTQVKEENQELLTDEPVEELVQLTNPQDVLMESNDDKEETKAERKRPRTKTKEVREDTDTDISAFTRSKDDLYDSFGKYVASMLRTMPKRRAMELQPKIVTLLTTGNLESDEDHVSQSDETISGPSAEIIRK